VEDRFGDDGAGGNQGAQRVFEGTGLEQVIGDVNDGGMEDVVQGEVDLGKCHLENTRNAAGCDGVWSLPEGFKGDAVPP